MTGTLVRPATPVLPSSVVPEYGIKWAIENGLSHLNPDHVAPQDAKFLFVDVETTGLELHRDMILEVGAVLTDAQGFVISEPLHFLTKPELCDPVRNAKALPEILELVWKMHEDSGLLDDLTDRAHRYHTYDQVEAELTEYVTLHCENPKSIRMAGSTTKFDYYMLREFMPTFVDSLHHRVIDASSLKELCMELNPDLYEHMATVLTPMKKHRVLPDLVDTLHEFSFYVDNFLVWGDI